MTPTVPGTQSVARTLQLLRLVAAHHAEGLDAQALTEACGLDRTTAHRLLKALVHAGLLSRTARGGPYHLGDEAMALGLAAMQQPPPLTRCIPAMKALARRAQEPVFLVVRSGDYSQCLHLEDSARPLRTFAETVGSQRLLGLGIPSFAMLSRMADADITSHYARHQAEYAAHRLSAAKLWRWVSQARANGYVHVSAQGYAGVALRLPLGSCADAAIGWVGPAARIPRSRGSELAALMRDELGRWGLL